MTFNEQYYQLTDSQWNALQKVSSISKMDCWFWLNHDEYGDFIQDLEDNSRVMCFSDGIGQLFEGVSDWDWSCLNQSERDALVQLSQDLFEEDIVSWEGQ